MSKTEEKSLIMETEKIENVRAFVRMRGLNIHELGGKLNGSYAPADAAVTSWKVLNDKTVVQTTNTGEPLPKKEGKNYFKFDKVMGESSSNQEVYEITAQDVVRDFVRGYSGSVITYGQTGAGKTFTMQGPRSLDEGTHGGGGIVHLAACDIFSNIQECPDSIFLIRLSVIEIYNEEIRDLLTNDQDESIVNFQYESKEGMMIMNGTEKLIPDYQTMIETLSLAESRRVVRATGMNDRSSRSHICFSFILERRNKEENNVLTSRLNLVDLAGSDSVHKVGTKLDSDLDKEGKAINKSLLALNRAITGLGRSKKAFINFRDSNLTRYLQRFLAGKDRVSIICCISPSGMSTEQTRKTLEFGKLARAVKTRVKLDVIDDDRSLILQSDRSPFPIDARTHKIQKSLIDGNGHHECYNNREVSESSSKIDETAICPSTISSSESEDSPINPESSTPIYSNSTDSKSLGGESTVSSFASSQALFLEIQEQWRSYKNDNSMRNHDNLVSDLMPNYNDQELFPGIRSTDSSEIKSEDDNLILVYTRTDDTNEAIASEFDRETNTESCAKNTHSNQSASDEKDDLNNNADDSQQVNKASEVAERNSASIPNKEINLDCTLIGIKENSIARESKANESMCESKDKENANENKEDNNYSETKQTDEIRDDEVHEESILEKKKKMVLEKENAAIAALSTRKESTGVLKLMQNLSNAFKTKRDDLHSNENDIMQTNVDNNENSLDANANQMTQFESDKISQSGLNILNGDDIEENDNDSEGKENQKVTPNRPNNYEKHLLEWEQLSESFRLFREECKNVM